VDFADKVAVVTGGSRGIGKEIALQLARHGANVCVTSRNQADAAAAAAELESHGVKARGYGCDVASFGEASAVGKAIVEECGRVDFLVNNAGIVIDKLLLRMSPEDFDAVLAVNLGGTFNFCKVFSPHFVKQRSGRIVNITSVVGITGNAGQANYAASKAGIIGLTKSLAKEFAPRGITVTAVAPGYVTTAMTETLPEDAKNAMLQAIPLKRFGTVQDVANVVMFLLSDMGDYVTGQVIHCDGGMVM